MNPLALKKHLEAIANKVGVSVKVAAVVGDDIAEHFASFESDGAVEKFAMEGEVEESPQRPLLSSNAYLGAFPIAMALKEGAQIVVTGILKSPFAPSHYHRPLCRQCHCRGPAHLRVWLERAAVRSAGGGKRGRPCD